MNRLSACSITPSLKQTGSSVDNGGATHTPVRPATSPDVCKFCGGPIDVEAQMPIGSFRFQSDDMCRACVADDLYDYAGNDR